MKPLTYDIRYLCQKMSDMSGLPIRIIYHDGKEIICSNTRLIADPMELCRGELFRIKEHVSYYITGHSRYYGIINGPDYRIIAGPGSSAMPSEQELHDLAFELDVSSKDYKTFSDALKAIVPMPLDSILQMMCTLNHVINNENLNISDLQIHDAIPTTPYNYGQQIHESDIYKNYNIEQQLTSIVASGDTAMLEKWVADAPTVRAGTMANNLIRQNKNAFIVSTALFSRTAINAGVSPEDAFRMSDSFIQQCENAQSIDEINRLNYQMVYDFTLEVGRKKKLTDDSSLRSSVYYYVLHNISEPITTSDLAGHLYMSRSHLSTLFKKTYGVDLNRYIHQIKTERARELLSDRSKSVTQIGDYLGYSSTSHFIKSFKKIIGMTPNEYRGYKHHVL